MSGISHLRSACFKTIIMVAGVIYLLFSVGVMKSTHFCMGREAFTNYFTSDDHGCVCSAYGDEDNNNGCCDNEHDLIKLQNDQKNISTYTIRIPQLFILDDLYTTQLLALDKPCGPVVLSAVNHDPEPPPVPLFVSNCSFVFYESEG